MVECLFCVTVDEAHELHGHTSQHAQHVAKQAAVGEVSLRHP